MSALVIAAQAPTSTAPLPVPPALGQLEPGLWQLEGKGMVSKQLCLADGNELIQIEHDQPGCRHFVVGSDAKSATVHYSCGGSGWGRTEIKIESAQLAHVHTQGISHKAPFEYQAQAHRIGDCAAASH